MYFFLQNLSHPIKYTPDFSSFKGGYFRRPQESLLGGGLIRYFLKAGPKRFFEFGSNFKRPQMNGSVSSSPSTTGESEVASVHSFWRWCLADNAVDGLWFVLITRSRVTSTKTFLNTTTEATRAQRDDNDDGYDDSRMRKNERVVEAWRAGGAAQKLIYDAIVQRVLTLDFAMRLLRDMCFAAQCVQLH